MCGIFGSNLKTSFYDLYLLNRSRGTYGTGIYCIRNNTSTLIYTNEELSLKDIPDNMDYYFGHNRAPTSETTSFCEETSHPFFTKNYAFAHNGIIKDTTKYEETFNTTYKVDSQWIGEFLEKFTLKNALQKISDNPFAVWVCTRHDPRKFYLSRVANPIYFNKKNNSFSSAFFEESKLLDEGKIYVGTAENLQWTLETFSFKSPYFIPG